MTITPETHDQIADYVLGILEGYERQTFEGRMASDPELARTVAAFQEPLSALDDTVEPAAVPAGLWANIEKAVAAARQQTPVNQNRPSNLMALLRPAALAASLAIAVGLGFRRRIAYATSRASAARRRRPALGRHGAGRNCRGIRMTTVCAIVPLEALIAPPKSRSKCGHCPMRQTGPVSLGTFQEARDLVLGGPDLPAPQPDQLYEITARAGRWFAHRTTDRADPVERVCPGAGDLDQASMLLTETR